MAVESCLCKWSWLSVIWVVSGFEIDASHKTSGMKIVDWLWGHIQYSHIKECISAILMSGSVDLTLLLLSSHILFENIIIHSLFCVCVHSCISPIEITVLPVYVRSAAWMYINIDIGHFYKKKMLSHFIFHVKWTILTTTLHEDVLVALRTWICTLLFCALAVLAALLKKYTVPKMFLIPAS
jgi:hypothetical protein